MVSRLRLCRATQSARASASATVHIASTSTASYSPKIKVDVIGSKPNASPKGFGRSPTIVFPGAVKTFTLSVFDSGVCEPTGAVTRVVSLSSFELSSGTPFDVRASDYSRRDWQKREDEIYWTNVSIHTKVLEEAGCPASWRYSARISGVERFSAALASQVTLSASQPRIGSDFGRAQKKSSVFPCVLGG